MTFLQAMIHAFLLIHITGIVFNTSISVSERYILRRAITPKRCAQGIAILFLTIFAMTVFFDACYKILFQHNIAETIDLIIQAVIY